MRPLRLEVKGFTAFRDRQEVDFSDVDVFAIAGPTGSGKSSLLDAMTYALYGRVERVGDRVSQLVSQGQPRMAVTLEFEVGHDRYRVTRSTPARGATRILLERLADGEWTQAGEGSDRVRDAERMIADAVGLTYDGFTRSVLLPQGRFAEFLMGDARKRRDILSELLDLQLFRRMAERAGQIARDAALTGETSTNLLEREYVGVTAETIREARVEAREARERAKALAGAARRVEGIVERWEVAERSTEDLKACAAEAADLSLTIGESASTLRELAEEALRAGVVLRSAAAAARRSAREFDKAQGARREAEETWGDLALLSGWVARAEALGEARHGAEALRSELEEARRLGEELSAAQAARQDEAARAGAATELAVEGERKADAAMEEARHGDLVATVSAGLKPGDPCPVCGTALKRAPRRRGTTALARAESARQRAEKARQGAERGLLVAERALASTQAELRANSKGVRRLERALKERDSDVRTRERDLGKAMGGDLPLDPAAALADRIERLEALALAEEAARDASRESERALRAAERERDRAVAAVAEIRAGVRVDVSGLMARAVRAAGGDLESPALPAWPSERTDPARVVAFATLLASALGHLARDLESLASRRAGSAPALVAEATEAVDGVVEWTGSLADLRETVAEARQRASARAATSQQKAADLEERLGRRGELEEEVRTLRARAEVFRALAGELRADRLVAFLQTEAMQLLAAAGSDRLATLSDGRYRLGCRDDEFFVLDTWNGDEERSVRTLSGGETFLASLALALALSEQVRSLSVTDRARLDSLFLDEGFGTLDPESLRVVVEAIEQLGGDGRLVGVITHVRELAEQFPRFEVEKSPRGSRVTLVA